MIAHISNLPYGATLENLELVNTNPFSLARTAYFYPRQSCSYDYISQPFSCPGAYFGVALKGYDEKGYAYQRIGVGVCPQLQCMNGGVNYNGRCLCQPLWTGPTCATPICLNGGTPMGSSCNCLENWAGTFCQQGQCIIL